MMDYTAKGFYLNYSTYEGVKNDSEWITFQNIPGNVNTEALEI